MGDDFFNTSGTSANHSRHVKAPVSSQKNVKDPLNGLPSIDLQNFESPEFEGSRYILTSPCSLEACSRVEVKPLNLLYKSLRDYEAENPEMPIREVYQLYETGEDKRKENLGKAREERRKILFASHNKPKSAKPVLSNPRVYETDSRKPIVSGLTRSSSFTNMSNADKTESNGNAQIPKANKRSSSFGRNSSCEQAGMKTYKLANHSATQTAASRSRPKDRKTQPVPVRNETFGSLSRCNLSNSIRGRNRSLSLDNSSRNRNEYNQKPEFDQRKHREEIIDRRFSSVPHHDSARENMVKKNMQIEQTKKELLMLERKYLRESQMMSEMNKKKNSLDNKKDKPYSSFHKNRYKTEENEKMSKEHYHQDNLIDEDYSNKNWKLQQTEEALRRAEQHRLEKEAFIKEKKKVENKEKFEHFYQRRAELERQTEVNVDELQEMMEMRDAVVQMNRKKIQSEREKFFTMTKNERERRMQATAERRRQLEAEIEDYKSEIMQYRDSTFTRVNNSMKKKLENDTKSIKEKRSERDRQYFEKIERIKRAENEWREEAEEILKMKDEKLKQLEEDRLRKIKESRELAHTAAKLREEIKREYHQGDSFDKLAQQTEIFNNLGLGHINRRY